MSEHSVFDAYPEVYENIDFILKCTDNRAYTIISGIFNAAPANVKERIIRAFCNIKTREVARSKPKPKSGGTLSTNDEPIYNFFAFIDTCHDFAEDMSDLNEIITILEYNDDTIPLPIKFDRRLLTTPHERELVAWLVKTQHFAFSKTRVLANPLYKSADIMQQFDIKQKVEKKPDITYEELYAKQQQYFRGKMGTRARTIPIDVFSIRKKDPEYENSYQELKLEQVAELCCTMRDFYGEDCRFQVDRTDDYLLLLVTNLHHISKAMYSLFIVRAGRAIASESDISEKLKHAIIRKTASGELVDTTWKVEMTDANFFDAALANTGISVDYSVTGAVYRHHMPYQIEINGIHPTTKVLRVKITDTGASTATEVDVTNKEATRVFSKNTIRLLASRASQQKKPAIATTVTVPLQTTLSYLSPATLYAIKRAGDWGQVQHCARYGKIFVTSDKFAALYAHYCKVRYIFLRRTEYFDVTKTLPDFVRYTFVLANSYT